MWHVSYRPEVEDDVVNAVTWYDDKRSGLGDEFLLEYLAAIQRFHPFFADDLHAEALDRLLSRLTAKPWNVKIHETYPHGEGVATYLARYLKGEPIKDSRLIDLRDGDIRLMERYRRRGFRRDIGLSRRFTGGAVSLSTIA